MGNGSQTISAARARIEREFEEPLEEVIQGYSVMGHSIPLVAATLDVSVSSVKHYCSARRIRFSRSPLEHREIHGRPPKLHRENGQEKSLTAWAQDVGLSVEGVRQRLRRRGSIR